MNKLCCLVSGVFLLVAGSHAIGLQHGVFRSQSTQGAAWQGTAAITSEKFDITVYPDYLDVDLEWVFTVGGAPPDSFKNALEIVGNLNLDAHSTVVGLITWYKGNVLKGKLKTDSVAKQQYENVVDRSAACPPPPRDPVLFEYGWGDDNYYISIFPASFDSTRTVRIRYLIPAFNVNGVNKIAYPYSFTPNPTVSIKKGQGVASYVIETDLSKKQFGNTTPAVLDNSVYSFEAYGGPGGQTISYIVPVLSGASNGSTIYCGSFSTPSFSGEMCHITTMSAEEALTQSSVKEDYVILWRWNHPKILAKYARQIVEQSTVLQKFLATLNAANKRAALIIAIEGESPITFHLDKQGGAEFNRMVAYLDSLGSQAVVDPPMSTIYKQLNVSFDAALELREFNAAVQEAMDLFEKNVVSLKHLLILTAGPQLITSYASAQNMAWDSTIDVGMLSSYLNEKEIDASVTMPLQQVYWPGADIGGFLQNNYPRLSVCATVSNGVDTGNIPVVSSAGPGSTYYSIERTTEMHVYSDQPLIKEIKWTIARGTNLVAEFTESPRVVKIADGTQYARLIGSSSYLVPLAAHMPTSIASNVGFIDTKYSLVALEEDSLPSSIARLYENHGVPELTAGDIFASADEHMEPVAQWLTDHPPQRMNHDLNGFVTGLIPAGLLVFEDAVVAAAPANVALADVNQPVRMAPFLQPIYTASSTTYPDYSDALAVKTESLHAPSSGMDMIIVKNGFLVINTGKLKMDNSKPAAISLFDCFGRIIGQWDVSAAQSCIIPLRTKLAHGAYIAQITCGSTKIVEPIVIR
ncbi:MAG: hypothetical protein WBM07_16870 [Chitinivibrionales bacterium]